jgi:hypothetical protein
MNQGAEHWNIRAKHEPGGSRGLQASESRGQNKRGFSPGLSLLRHNTHLAARNLSRTCIMQRQSITSTSLDELSI